MSVSMKTTNAPGIVQCAIFKNEDASDEIDLELIQGRVDTPIWKDAVKPRVYPCFDKGLFVAILTSEQSSAWTSWAGWAAEYLTYQRGLTTIRMLFHTMQSTTGQYVSALSSRLSWCLILAIYSF